jgi:thiol-disulfide isomerase/thioredoxin
MAMRVLVLAAALGFLAQAKDRPAQGSGPEVGKPAPDWKLRLQDGKPRDEKADVVLSKLKGKPVFLIFGSWTWPPFRKQAEALERLHKEYKDRAHFYVVYILEAHPEDGWKVPANEKDGVRVRQPRTYEERVQAAGECMKGLKLTIPCLVDDMENTAQKAYAGWPDRLYVIDAAGDVAYKGDPGPRGFVPLDAEAALKKRLQEKK